MVVHELRYERDIKVGTRSGTMGCTRVVRGVARVVRGVVRGVVRATVHAGHESGRERMGRGVVHIHPEVVPDTVWVCRGSEGARERASE